MHHSLFSMITKNVYWPWHYFSEFEVQCWDRRLTFGRW